MTHDVTPYDLDDSPPPPPRAHPFTVPAGSDAEMFIQWKGTEVCLDFYCPCGRSSHYDGGFAYFLRCGCGAVYEMGTQVIAKRTERPSGIVQDLDMDEATP